MRNIYLALLTVLLLNSCDGTLNQTITKENIEATALKIKEDKDLDSLKIEILDNLVAISKGRYSYIKQQKSESLSKYIIDDEKFVKNVDDLFNKFTTDKITYKILLKEADSLNQMREGLNKKFETVYKEIDNFCATKQKEIDEREVKAKRIKDSLNQMVKIKLLSIKETEIDYKDVIEVALQLTNLTNKKVEAIAFDLELTDKLGTVVATLGCKSNSGFSKSDIKFWYYDRWDNSEIYKSLRNTSASHVTAKQEITKLNLAGELLSAYPMLDNYETNFSYKSPDKLTGYCPYLDKDDELTKKVDSEQEKMFKRVKDELKALSMYNEFNGQVYDFSK